MLALRLESEATTSWSEELGAIEAAGGVQGTLFVPAPKPSSLVYSKWQSVSCRPSGLTLARSLAAVSVISVAMIESMRATGRVSKIWSAPLAVPAALVAAAR